MTLQENVRRTKELMKTLKQLERLQKAHKLILQESTGTPKEFAKRLYISERQLFNLLEYLKGIDAPILFSRKTNTYYYSYDFDLLVNVSVQVLANKELKTIYAGQTLLTKNYFTARLVQ